MSEATERDEPVDDTDGCLRCGGDVAADRDYCDWCRQPRPDEITLPCVVCEGSGCRWLTTDEDQQGEPVWRRFVCSACDGTGTRWPS